MKIGTVFLGIIVLFLALGPFRQPIVDGIKGWRTTTNTESFVVVTDPAETTANVTLAYDLYQAATAEIISIDSSIAETPAASAYEESTLTLTVDGLDDDNSRTLAIEYYGETDDTVMQILGPFLGLLIFGAIVGCVIWAMVSPGGKKGHGW